MAAKLTPRRLTNVQARSARPAGHEPVAQCMLCKKNGEAEDYYTSHKLRDENDQIQCPVLLSYTCPRCNVTGDHTLSYCPLKIHQQAKKVAPLPLKPSRFPRALNNPTSESPKRSPTKQVKSSQLEGELISLNDYTSLLEKPRQRRSKLDHAAWRLPHHGLQGGNLMLDQLLIATCTTEPDQRASFVSCMGYSFLRFALINQIASAAEEIIRRELAVK